MTGLTSRRLLNRYGSKGILKIPQGNGIYTPSTGDTTFVYDDYDVLYVPFPVSTTTLDNFGLDAFAGNFVTFMFTNQDIAIIEVNTTAFIDDIDNNRHDIQAIQKLLIKDNIVLFQAETTVRK